MKTSKSKKTKKMYICPKVKYHQRVLEGLIDERISLYDEFLNIEKMYNELGADVESAEKWLLSLPIESLSEMNGKHRSKLGDLKKRSELRKESIKTIKQINIIDSEIKMAELDLIKQKVNTFLGKIE